MIVFELSELRENARDCCVSVFTEARASFRISNPLFFTFVDISVVNQD